MRTTLSILSVVDCIKVEWHEFYIYPSTTGLMIHKYFEKYYNKNLDIDLDKLGHRYRLKNITDIIKYIEKNPSRMCLYIYFRN